MSKLNRLLQLGGKGDDEESQEAGAPTPDPPPTKARMELFTPYSMHEQGGSETVQQPAVNPAERRDSTPHEDPAETKIQARPTVKNYDQFGEQVASVLASAELAAEQIRQSAQEEAKQLQSEAQEKADARLAQATEEVERTHREVEQLRADADTYSEETRAAADRHEAEMRAKAEQKARDIEAEARLRHTALLEEVEETDARLQQLLRILRGMTTRLEGLVSTEPARRPDAVKREGSGNEALEEVLSPQRSPGGSA